MGDLDHDPYPDKSAGDPIYAEEWNAMRRITGRSMTGENMMSDHTGTHFVSVQGKGKPERFFELKTALTPGELAEAHPATWDGEAWIVNTEEDAVFDVRDTLGVFRGRARDAYSEPHNLGSRGLARWCSEQDVWRIVELQPHALTIDGKLTDDLATTDSTFEIDNVRVMQPTGAIIVHADPAEPITVNNKFSWEGDEEGYVQAQWNEAIAEFDEDQVECPVEGEEES